MTPRQKIEVEQSTHRERINALLGQETRSAEEGTELSTLTARMQALEIEYRAAVVAEPDTSTVTPTMDSEHRERLELRSKASLGRFLVAAMKGRAPTGAEAELADAAGVDGIPLELWDVPETREVTGAPATGVTNIDPLRPMLFAPSIVGTLGVDMPMVPSGSYATGTITTAATAGPVAKSAEVVETAAAFTVQTTTPHRVGASLNLTVEDVASVGSANFESILREHISLTLSDELDDQMLNGAGGGNNLTGLFERLTDAPAPAAAVETWTRFLKIQSGQIDGLFASELSHIQLLVGVDTFRLAAATFQGNNSEQSAASYLKANGAGFATNKRMPAKASHIQPGIAIRKGRGGMQTAVCPHWGSLSIDDVYSGARKGERRYVVSVLLGDVILVQPAAYAEVAFRVST